MKLMVISTNTSSSTRADKKENKYMFLFSLKKIVTEILF
jgi:hypothetical protein